jgi:hypothetical protein
MPLIKARNQDDTKKVSLAGQITFGQNKLLKDYATFLNEKTGWVVGQMIEHVTEKDRDFQDWKRAQTAPTKMAKSA